MARRTLGPMAGSSRHWLDLVRVLLLLALASSPTLPGGERGQGRMDWLEIVLRLGLATLAGMIVGIERELRHKPAGLRTHMLVCLGSAAAVLVALELDANASRVVQGVVTGIGFIGAGAVLHSAKHVEGLTTAASIWTCTMIGLAAGGGFYKIALVTLFLTLFILAGCVVFDRILNQRGPSQF